MENEYLFEIALDYLSRIEPPFRHPLTGKPAFYQLRFGNAISNKDLKRAKKSYAPYNPDEEAPILIHQRVFFGLVIGFLITNRALYYKLFSVGEGTRICGKFNLIDIKSFDLKFKNNWIIYINEIAIGEFGGLQSVHSEIDLVIDFVNTLTNAIRTKGENRQ